MQPPAGALTCAEPPIVRARRGHTMTEAHLFAIGVLLAWLAGIRVYLTVFGIGLAGFFGWLDLPQALEVTASPWVLGVSRSEEHTSELQPLMRISYAVICLKKKTKKN